MKNTTDITIYTSPNCPYCDATKLLLDWNDINYMETDITKMRKGGDKNVDIFKDQSLPIIFVDDEYIGSYQQLVELITQEKL